MKWWLNMKVCCWLILCFHIRILFFIFLGYNADIYRLLLINSVVSCIFLINAVSTKSWISIRGFGLKAAFRFCPEGSYGPFASSKNHDFWIFCVLFADHCNGSFHTICTNDHLECNKLETATVVSIQICSILTIIVAFFGVLCVAKQYIKIYVGCICLALVFGITTFGTFYGLSTSE